MPHLARKRKQDRKAFLEGGVGGGLALEVADEAAEAGAQELEGAAGALELMGVVVAPDHDRSPLGDPEITLAQRHAGALGECHQLDEGLVHQPRAGRMGDGLGLHRGADGHPLEVLAGDRTGLVRDRQALLEQGHELLLAEALAPAAKRGALEGELVAEAHRQGWDQLRG